MGICGQLTWVSGRCVKFLSQKEQGERIFTGQARLNCTSKTEYILNNFVCTITALEKID
jgi:hypothetical protein